MIYFMPGIDRKKPHHLELVLNLEPNNVYSIYFKTEFAYLKWDEYPPDVNHGFYINSALVSIRVPANEHSDTQLRTFNLYSNLYNM